MKLKMLGVIHGALLGALLAAGAIPAPLVHSGEVALPRSSPIDLDPGLTPPVVTVHTLKSEGSERGDFRSRVFSFRFERTAPIGFELPVFYEVSGTAKNGVDFQTLSGQIVIPAGESGVDLLAETIRDDLVEGDEWVVAEVKPPACIKIFPPPKECYQVGDASVAKAVIHDDDGVTTDTTVSIEATIPATKEVCAPNTPCTKELILPGEFTITRSGSLEGNLSVFLAYGGAAIAGSDYAGLPKEVTLTSGQRELRLQVLGLGDYLKEGDETVVATVTPGLLSSDSSVPPKVYYQVNPEHASATVVIHDRPSVLLTGIQITAPGFGDSFPHGLPLTIQALATDEKGAITRVEFFDGAAKIGESNLHFFQAPEPGSPIQHELVWRDAPFGEHVLTARGMAASGVTLSSEKVLIRVKPDGALLPTISLVTLDSETSELAPHIRVKPATIGVNRSGDAREALRVWVEFGGTATLGKDYEASHWVEIPAGVISTQLLIAGTDDDLVEDSETVVVRLGMPPIEAPQTYEIDPTYNTARVVIHDSDGGTETPIVSVKATQPTTSEPCPVCLVLPGVFTADRTGSTERSLTVFFSISGTADNGIDFEKIGSSVEIPVGKSSADVRVLARLDEIVEAPEAIVLELVSAPTASPIDSYRIDADASAAKIAIYDRPDQADRAVARIVSPKFGERFVNPESIAFMASTLDPKGAITHLDWFTNGDKIGASDIFFIRAPDSGVPVSHEFHWNRPDFGQYKVVAVGSDASGNRVESDTILVEVVPKSQNEIPDRVEVDIVQSDSVAGEADETGQVDEGVLKIRRISGRRDVDVRVELQVSGTAVPGNDYVALPERVLIPAGEDSVALIITPIPDKAAEADKFVVVTVRPPICPAIFPPPPSCYLVSKMDTARVVIRGEVVENGQLPKVALIAPQQGEVFERGTTIKMGAIAFSPGGKVVLVELLADGKILGATQDSDLTFEWKDAAAGAHRLIARATDDRGMESSSSPVEIFVRDSTIDGMVFPDRAAAHPHIEKIGWDASGRVHLQVGGPKIQLIAVEVSDDLRKWYQLDPALLPSDGILNLNDTPDPKVQFRFYRVKPLPMAP